MNLTEIKLLEDELGPTLVAALSRNRHRHITSRWLSGLDTPTSCEKQRLEVALELIRMIGSHESPDVARQWFIACNVRGELTPWQAIRSDDFAGAKTSAHRFIEGNGGY